MGKAARRGKRFPRRKGDPVSSQQSEGLHRAPYPVWFVDLGVAFAALTWGINHAVVKHALESMQPLAFNSIRLGIGSMALLLVLWLAERDFSLDRQDVLLTILVGFLGHTCFQILFILGLNLTTAGKTSVIFALSPTFAAFMEQVAGTGRYTLRGWLGTLVSLGGVALVTVSRKTGATGGGLSPGDLLELLATICWAAYTVMARPLLRKYSPLKVTALTMVSGAIPLVAFSAPALLREDWRAVTGAAWASLAFSTCFPIVICYVLWSWGIQRIGSGRTVIYNNLSPLAGSLSSWVILRETWTLAQVAGAALVLSGVAQVRAGVRPAEVPAGRNATRSLNASP